MWTEAGDEAGGATRLPLVSRDLTPSPVCARDLRFWFFLVGLPQDGCSLPTRLHRANSVVKGTSLGLVFDSNEAGDAGGAGEEAAEWLAHDGLQHGFR